MTLTCPNCKALIPAQSVEAQEAQVVCAQCNHVFDYQRGASAPKSKPHSPRPKQLQVRQRGLELSYRRVQNQTGETILGLSPFAFLLLILAFILFLTTIPVLFFLGLGLLVVASSYAIAALLLNRTLITVGDVVLAVKMGPLPFPGADDVMLDSREVERVFCDETEKPRRGGTKKRYFDVRVRIENGSYITLLKALPQEYAFYIAHTLENCLQEMEEARIADDDDNFLAETDAAPGEDTVVRMAHLLAPEDDSQNGAL